MSEKMTHQCVSLVMLSFSLMVAFQTLSVKATAQETSFVDNPVAHRLFDQMNEAFRDAESISFECQFEKEVLGVARNSCTYQVWLKKPNLFRVEVQSDAGERGGVMIGDGTHLWIHWPSGRPRFPLIKERQEQDEDRLTCFMKRPAKNTAKTSIWHTMPLLGYGASSPILNVSIFHGRVDSLAKHIDGIRLLGEEVFDGHACQKIEVSMLDHQRSHYLWLSKQDQLPRRLVELARLDHDVVTREVWSSLKIDEKIPDSFFTWSPPPTWKEWTIPADEDAWPKIGSQAPDFDLLSIDGSRIKLSSYRGKVVFLNFWRIGCPACIAELPDLKAFQSQYRESGLVLMGINVSDDRKQLARFLDEQGITYPNVLDTSESATQIYDSSYGVGAIPTNCVVDRSGKIVDMWVGFSKERMLTAIRNAGIDDSMGNNEK